MAERENFLNIEGTDHSQVCRRKGVFQTLPHEKDFHNQVDSLIHATHRNKC